MEYFKLLIFIAWSFSWFSLFVSLKQGLISKYYIVIASVLMFAVFESYLFKYFIEPGLIYDFMLILLASLIIKLAMINKIGHLLLESQSDGFSDEQRSLALSRMKKAKYLSLVNIVWFFIAFFVSYVLITSKTLN